MLSLALMLLLSAAAFAADAPAIQRLFHDGDAGYPRFRIPALAALDNGTLLAFAEARSPEFPGQHDDHARNDIVLRRSPDAGATWPIRRTLYPGGFAYSSLAILPGGRIACLFERGPYETLSFTTVTLEALHNEPQNE